tara:strand:- start:197 stop:1375 length:1179 start_codon:yes stop_codon:yes gene_type:complete
MKLQVLTTLIFIPVMLFSQSWKYKSGGSDFDGKYKTSYVQGSGNEFPYESPLMAINKFDRKDGFNFYISGAGYSQEDTGLTVLWVFNNEPDTIYSSYGFSISSDGKIIFFEEFTNSNSEDKISSAEFINKLKSASKVSVRVKDKFSSNDLVFSLSGSTKAINFVLPDLDSMISDIVQKRNIFNETKKQKAAKIDELIYSIESIKLSSTSLLYLKNELKDTNKNYKSIKVVPVKYEQNFLLYGYVDLYYILDDGTEDRIYGTFNVEMDSKLIDEYKEKQEAERIKKEELQQQGKENIATILQKYSFEPLKERIISQVSNFSRKGYSQEGQFELYEIKDIMIVFKDYSYKKFWDCQIEIKLIDDRIINTKLLFLGLEITKKVLKSMGSSNGQKF